MKKRTAVICQLITLEHADAADHCDGRRNGRPGQGIFDAPRGVGRRRDAAGEGAGELIGEIARAVAGQMIEKIEPEIRRLRRRKA